VRQGDIPRLRQRQPSRRLESARVYVESVLHKARVNLVVKKRTGMSCGLFFRISDLDKLKTE
jgi:hypothetical protein